MSSSGRRHVSTACDTCRKRKNKCDGNRPVCGLCQTKSRVCDWSGVVDGRHANRPHQRVAKLEAEVTRLRRLLRRDHPELIPLGKQRGDSLPRSGASSRESSEDESTHAATDNGAARQEYRAVDSLQLDTATGSYVFMGPTSIPPRPEESTAGHSVRWYPFINSNVNPEAFNISVEAHDELLKDYFTYLNGFYSFVDEQSFRQGLEAQALVPSPVHPDYSPFLHLCMLSCACHISTQPDVPTDGSSAAAARGWPFLQAAMSLLESELNRPRPTTVVGLCLLVVSLADLGKTSTAWIYCGIAIRVAQELGLQVNVGPLVERGKMSPETARLRDDAFWTVYVQDFFLALYVGRSPALTNDDFDLPFPVLLRSDSQPLAFPDNRSLVNRAMRCALVSQGRVWSRIMSALYNVRRHPNSIRETVGILQTELHLWRSELPPILSRENFCLSPSPHTLMIHAVHFMAVILLNRPLLGRRCLDAPEGVTSLNAALETLDLARTFDQTFAIQKAPVTINQCLHVAASFLILLLADLYDQEERSADRTTAQNALEEVLLLTSRLSQSWGCAGQSLSGLSAMQSEYAVRNDDPMSLPLGFDMPWLNDWLQLDGLDTNEMFAFGEGLDGTI